MIQRTIKRLSLRALVVDDELTAPTAEGRAARALVQELHGRGVEVVEAASAEDGMSTNPPRSYPRVRPDRFIGLREYGIPPIAKSAVLAMRGRGFCSVSR